MDNFIKIETYKLFKTLRHHDASTGIIADLQVNTFLSIKDDILYLAKLFSFLDDTFEDELIQKMFIDVVSVINFVEMLGTQRQIKIYYHQYKEENPTATDTFDDFKHSMVKAMKVNKLKTLAMLNTKLYYFDILIWNKAKDSIKIDKYLTSTSMKGANDTHQFLLLNNKINTNNANNILKVNFIVEKKNLYVQYATKELEYLFSLKIHNETFQIEENMQKLLKFKNKVAFFKDMSDEDIQTIVKNVKFVHFDTNEVIIYQDGLDETIYFVLEGECRVNVGNKSVGSIKKHRILGEFSVITKERRSATIRANQPTTLLVFELALEKFDDNPYSFAFLYKNITRELITKISVVNNKQY